MHHHPPSSSSSLIKSAAATEALVSNIIQQTPLVADEGVEK